MVILTLIVVFAFGIWFYRTHSIPQDAKAKLLIEWLVVLLGAWFAAGKFLSPNPNYIPAGREFLSSIHYYHFWEWVGQCGKCALWAPFNGGYPFMADPSQGVLYPLVAIPVMLFGVIGGVKVSIFLSVLSAGLAMWWLGYLWKLRAWVRVWAAWMIMASGLIAGRLELGDMHTVLSISALVWLFPTWWYLWQGKGKYSFLPFAWWLGLSVMAARGYHLFGMLFAWGIMALITWWGIKEGQKRLLTRSFFAVLGGAMLSAPVWIPLLRLMPYMAKETDAKFRASQTFGNTLFNFLINDYDFYKSPILGKLPFPHLTVFFIGWIPFLLAIYGFSAAVSYPKMRDKRSAAVVFAIWAVLLIWLATGQPMRWALSIVGDTPLRDFLAGFRHIEQIGALAIYPILALSMLGIEAIVLQTNSWAVQTRFGAKEVRISSGWLLAIFLVVALRQGWNANKNWLGMINYPDLPELKYLEAVPGEWVAPPFGEHFWMEPAVADHLKVLGILRWWWKDWKPPEPRRKLVRAKEPPKPKDGEKVVQLSKDLFGVENPNVFYAYLATPSGERIPCHAQGWGGKITISCPEHPDGELWVMEHPWHGWQVKTNGPWRQVKDIPPYIHFPLPAETLTAHLAYTDRDFVIGVVLAALWILWQVGVLAVRWLLPRQLAYPEP